MRKTAVIVAGGTGTRMGTEQPKQFLLLSGVPVIIHTLRRFLDFDPTLELVVVMHPGSMEEWEKIKHAYLSPDDMARIHSCPGGKQRTESVFNGLSELERRNEAHTPCLVAIHDAVRPLVTGAMLQQAFEVAGRSGASVCCVPVKSSLREQTDGGSRAVDRSRFFHVQTPQTFNLDQLIGAYRQRPHDHFTDDASLFEASGGNVQICEGSYDNLKITTPEDMFVAEAILKREG